MKTHHIFNEGNVPASGTLSVALGFFRSSWMKQDQKLTLLHDNVYKQGYLSLNKDNYWGFVTQGRDGRVMLRVDLKDIEYSWKMRLQENTMEIGWQENIARRIFGVGCHVSAANFHHTQAPGSLKEALSTYNPDRQIWLDSYNKEFDGLTDLNVHTVISEEEYREYVRKYGEAVVAIPTMNIFTIKVNKEGHPVRAKSRIVALGNVEKRIRSRGDRYAPVLSSISS